MKWSWPLWERVKGEGWLQVSEQGRMKENAR